MRVKSRMVLVLWAALWTVSGHAAEGMWTLDNVPQAALQQHQFKADAKWVDRVMHSAVRLAQGCSGSFVSPEGLVLTNHHCAERCIEGLSSRENDYNLTGFLARTRAAEKRCPELELNQLDRITDVTERVKAATAGKSGDDFRMALNAINAQIAAECVGKAKDRLRCDVVELYHGGRYHLYRYNRFQDVRLVWAPEQAAAFFGGDPDNFNFPRYDLDATLLRAYDKGKPVVSKQYFRFKRAGAAENELTFTLGHPGSTQRELTTAQLETQRDIRLPRSLLLYSELRGVLTQYRKSGEEASRIANADLFSVENSIKSWRGQFKALIDPALFDARRQQEQALRQQVAANPALADTTKAWDEIAAAEVVGRLIGDRYYFIESGRGVMSKYFTFARTLVRGAAERAKPDAERLPEFADAALPAVEQSLFSSAPLYPEYEKLKLAWSLTKLREWLGADDPLVQKMLGRESPESLAAKLIDNSLLKDPEVRRQLWTKPETLRQFRDPMVDWVMSFDDDARSIRRRYENEVQSAQQRAGQKIAEARFAVSGTSVYPDATFTLRLSYGQVQGWMEGETAVRPFTDLGGAFRRHTGEDPFALPPSWLKARSAIKQDTPFNFVTTNDIVGGNSGSPVINRNAELVGLIFDGNIQSLGGTYGYDPRLNRAVAVHPGAILESLRSIYNAPELLRELNAK